MSSGEQKAPPPSAEQKPAPQKPGDLDLTEEEKRYHIERARIFQQFAMRIIRGRIRAALERNGSYREAWDCALLQMGILKQDAAKLRQDSQLGQKVYAIGRNRALLDAIEICERETRIIAYQLATYDWSTPRAAKPAPPI